MTPNNSTQHNFNLLAKEKIDLQEYIFTLKRHKWSILQFSALAVLITALVVFSMRPVYRATASLLIEAQQAKIVSIQEIYGLDTGNSEYYSTQFEILRSRELIEKVVKSLDLLQNPEFDTTQKKSLVDGGKSWLSAIIPFDVPFLKVEVTRKELSEEERLQIVVDKFLQSLSISPVKKTQIVNIIFEAHDPNLAAKAANVLANAYIESHLDARLQMTHSATSWLTERMESMKNKVVESEKNLQKFREKENIIELAGVRSLASKDLQEISSNYINAKEKRAATENLYKQVKSLEGQPSAAYESIPEILKHNLIQNMKNAESNAERDLAELAKRYGPQHPKMVAAQSKLTKATQNLQKQISTVVSGIENEYELAKSNEENLKQAIEKSKREIQELNRKEFRLRELEREAETNRKLYDTFFTRFQETDATSDMQSVNARIMDHAVVPRGPAKPRKNLAILVALLIGLLLGVIRALVKEHLANTFRSTEDVEAKLGIASLGILPLTKSGRLKKLNPLEIFSRSEYVALAESIRTIRTGLILSGLDEPKKVTLVTSSLPNEGKTTLSIGLAIALGQVENVLLIDADLRHPSLTKNFDIPPNAPGLSTLVAGTEKLDNCIHKTGKAGIDLLPAGLAPPNPLELLSSKRFRSTMEELCKRYDRIIIDSAPTQAVSDALILSSHAQSVIYVVKADATASHVARSGVKRLIDSNAPLTGIVLNQLDVMKASKFTNYEYYNGGYYGQYGSAETPN